MYVPGYMGLSYDHGKISVLHNVLEKDDLSVHMAEETMHDTLFR